MEALPRIHARYLKVRELLRIVDESPDHKVEKEFLKNLPDHRVVLTHVKIHEKASMFPGDVDRLYVDVNVKSKQVVRSLFHRVPNESESGRGRLTCVHSYLERASAIHEAMAVAKNDPESAKKIMSASNQACQVFLAVEELMDEEEFVRGPFKDVEVKVLAEKLFRAIEADIRVGLLKGQGMMKDEVTARAAVVHCEAIRIYMNEVQFSQTGLSMIALSADDFFCSVQYEVAESPDSSGLGLNGEIMDRLAKLVWKQMQSEVMDGCTEGKFRVDESSSRALEQRHQSIIRSINSSNLADSGLSMKRMNMSFRDFCWEVEIIGSSHAMNAGISASFCSFVWSLVKRAVLANLDKVHCSSLRLQGLAARSKVVLAYINSELEKDNMELTWIHWNDFFKEISWSKRGL